MAAQASGLLGPQRPLSSFPLQLGHSLPPLLGSHGFQEDGAKAKRAVVAFLKPQHSEEKNVKKILRGIVHMG